MSVPEVIRVNRFFEHPPSAVWTALNGSICRPAVLLRNAAQTDS
jgi:hypothetical protein